MDVETIYGTITLTPQARDVIHARTPDGAALRVNGVDHSVNGHLYRHPDGWHATPIGTARTFTLHVSRVDAWDGVKFRDATSSAIRRITCELESVCQQVSADDLASAERERTAGEITRRETEIAACRDHVRALQREIRLLKSGGRVEYRQVGEWDRRERQVIVSASGRIVRTRSANFEVR